MYSSESVFENLRSSAKDGDSLVKHLRETFGVVERLHIDFKEKANRKDGVFEEVDWKNLARAVSGFANSGGGVLVWGVEDGSLKPKPIGDVQAFVARCLERSPTITDPAVPNIDGHWISHDGNPDLGYGFIHVPESPLPPHRVILTLPKVNGNYYVRSGSSFVVATHSQLEDMFGRRPKPLIEVEVSYGRGSITGQFLFDLNCFISLRNIGRGPALGPYLSLDVREPYRVSEYGVSGQRDFALPLLPVPMGEQKWKFGANADFIIHSGMSQSVANIKVPIDRASNYHAIEDLNLEYQFAAVGLPITGGTLTIGGLDLQRQCATVFGSKWDSAT